MRNIVARHGSGEYRAGESHWLAYNRGLRMDGSEKVIICCHGHGANSLQFLVAGAWSLGKHSEALLDAGFVLLGIDAGGPVAWGGPAAMTAINDAIAWAGSFASTDRVGLMGWSMGGLTVLNWLNRNKAKTAGALMWSPALDLLWGEAINPTWATELRAVYGGAGLPNRATYNPMEDFALYRDLPFPARIVTAVDDPTTTIDKARQFIGLVDDSESIDYVEVPASAGVGHFPFGGYPVQSTVDFYKGLEW